MPQGLLGEREKHRCWREISWVNMRGVSNWNLNISWLNLEFWPAALIQSPRLKKNKHDAARKISNRWLSKENDSSGRTVLQPCRHIPGDVLRLSGSEHKAVCQKDGSYQHQSPVRLYHAAAWCGQCALGPLDLFSNGLNWLEHIKHPTDMMNEEQYLRLQGWLYN